MIASDDGRPPGGPGPRSAELGERLRECETANVTWLGSDFPVFWAKGAGCEVEDVDERRYLDGSASFGVAALGHSHPSVVAAIHAQAQVLVHGMGDVHPPSIKVELLERLRALAPIEDARITLGTSGTMSTEIARKAAACATGRRGVIAFEGGYHGLSLGALEIAGQRRFAEPLGPLVRPAGALLPFPSETCAPEELEAIAGAARDALTSGPEPAGALVVEPIQGRGGVRVMAPGFLSRLAELCRQHGALLIVDEIFTGWHRTGPRFACMDEGVEPDLLLVGKALGGGLPIGACIGRREVMDAFGPSGGEALHTETFLGNPLTMAAALAVLDVLCVEGRRDAVERSGARLRRRMADALAPLGARVGPVRGRGLMLGAPLYDSEGRPDPPLAARLMKRSLAEGLIVLGGGVDGSVLQLTPPLVATDEELDEMGRRLQSAARAIAP